MNGRLIVIIVWLVSAGVPYAWWIWNRRRVDVWKALPVPAALLDETGAVRATAGPDWTGQFTVADGLPARGRVVRGRTTDGTPVALSGVQGGALAVALPADPVADRRDQLLAEIAPRLAHDVYTPLTAVVGHLDLLAHEPISETARQSVALCQAEVQRIATLSRDLLALTAIRSGRADRAVRSAASLAEEAIAGLLARADELGATLTVETPAERAFVDVADGDLIRALRNLVGNALTHGLGDRKQITVRVHADDDTVTFAVHDGGPGIDPADLPRLCEPFQRNGHKAGSGLGLAIVAEVLAVHGSTLALERDPTGATFSFTLPRVSR